MAKEGAGMLTRKDVILILAMTTTIGELYDLAERIGIARDMFPGDDEYERDFGNLELSRFGSLRQVIQSVAYGRPVDGAMDKRLMALAAKLAQHALFLNDEQYDKSKFRL